eukprot:680463-Hanusia_phi.AAC.4
MACKIGNVFSGGGVVNYGSQVGGGARTCSDHQGGYSQFLYKGWVKKLSSRGARGNFESRKHGATRVRGRAAGDWDSAAAAGTVGLGGSGPGPGREARPGPGPEAEMRPGSRVSAAAEARETQSTSWTVLLESGELRRD